MLEPVTVAIIVSDEVIIAIHDMIPVAVVVVLVRVVVFVVVVVVSEVVV